MNKKILITGGSGLVGRQLTVLLINSGYDVAWLSRSKKANHKCFIWDYKSRQIDSECLTWPNVVVHLAGVSIMDKRFSQTRKKEIMDSRVESAQFLLDSFNKSGHKLEAFISASGVSYYGINSGDKWMPEYSPMGTGFLAEVCKCWENVCKQFEQINARTVSLRVGLVMSKEGGAYPSMSFLVKMGLGSALGHGKQWISWIHIDDLVSLFTEAIRNPNYTGIYNAVSPDPKTNKEFMRSIAKVLQKPFILPPVPGFLLKLALGERSHLALGGQRVSVKKLNKLGFHWQFRTLENAIANLNE